VKKLITAAAAASLLVAVGAPAAQADKGGVPSTNKVANKLCNAEKKADKAAFKATYGPQQAMRNCREQNRPEASAELKNASQECRAERTADPNVFGDTYGTNPNGKNAFGKCVSSKVKAAKQEEAAEFKNAAKECRTEREADADAFAETYGTNANRKNAFGKCVSTKVKEADEEDETTTPVEPAV
jgi:hypothetical protein